MIDLGSPRSLEAAAAKVTLVVSGWYYWEYLGSLDFEWKFLSGKRRFRWPMIFYFGARYSILVVVTILMVLVNVTTELDCNVLLTLSGLAGQGSSGFTSLIFATRTMVIWDYKRNIVILLSLLSVGHWISICLGGLYTHSAWIPGPGCAPGAHFPGAIVATLIYALCYDFLVAALAVYKLTDTSLKRSHLVDLILKDGLLYYIVAVFANVPAIAALSLSSNQVVVQMFNFPASVAYTVAATRAIRRLANFSRESSASPASEMARSVASITHHSVALPGRSSLPHFHKAQVAYIKMHGVHCNSS